MTLYRLHTILLICGAFIAVPNGYAQVPFSLDTTFRANFDSWYVASLALLEDGKVLLSGRIRFPGELDDQLVVRLNSDGSRDLAFPGPIPGGAVPGGGKLTAWSDRFYVATNTAIRRIWQDGTLDYDFIHPNNGPYFTSLQGGDYHVFPDGRVLMTGYHSLNDTARGFVGYHNFIWFTNTGHLDTTRVHRKGNGAIFRFAEMPSDAGPGMAGKFLASGTGTIYDGRPVGSIFRIHSDGSLDTTFQTGAEQGLAFAYLPTEEGKALIAGNFFCTQSPGERIWLARFLPDGALDPSFTRPVFGMGDIPDPSGNGPTLGSLVPYRDGMFFAMGNFQFVNGQPRRGICLFNAYGDLMELFDDCGVGMFTYQGVTTASVRGIMEDPIAERWYIWGSYHGYADGTVNDTAQRFVTRLHGGDTDLGFHAFQEQLHGLSVYPNPVADEVRIQWSGSVGPATIQLLDALGREVLRRSAQGNSTTLDVSALVEGVYLLRVASPHGGVLTQRLVVQR